MHSLSISITYPVHIHLNFIHNTLSISKSLYHSHYKSYIINSCHVTIPCVYEWVSNECKCSGN